MIELIEGRGVGAGKSYMVMERLLPHWTRGGTACVSDTVEVKWEACKEYARRRAGVVLQDDQLRVIHSDDLQRLHEVTPPGTAELPVLIVVDEAQDAFNARDWSDKGKRPFFSWLCQSRHDDNDLIILSQAVANIDKQVRRLCTFIWVTRNTEYFPVGGKPLAEWLRIFTLGMWDGRCFIRTQLDQDGRTALGKTWHIADRGLFGCYESKAMRLKHRRASEAVARKKLQIVRSRSPMIKYIVLALVIAAVIGGCKVVGSMGRARVSQVGALPGVSGSVVLVSQQVAPLKNGDVLRRTFRASGRNFLFTAEDGLLAKGEDCALGHVEDVGSSRAVVRVSQSVRVFVEARPLSSAPRFVVDDRGGKKP